MAKAPAPAWRNRGIAKAHKAKKRAEAESRQAEYASLSPEERTTRDALRRQMYRDCPRGA